jgi:hypothetical protein
MTAPITAPQLAEAIQKLYRAFKPIQVRRHPEGCPCCVSDADRKRLFSKPLAELSAEDLGRFAWKALTTWGTVEDLKHFLPRLLELVAMDECAPFEREVLFGKLRLGAWTTWPESERGSVENYLDAVWKDCLASEAGSVWLDELLCGLGNAVDDLNPFLEVWTTCRIGTGYSHFVAFLDWNSATLLKRRHLTNSFWSDAGKQMSQVIDWLANPRTVAALEGIFAENADSAFSGELAVAVDRLSDLQRTLATN